MKIKNVDFKVFKNKKALNSLLNTVRINKDEVIVWRFVGDKKITAKARIILSKKNSDEIWIKAQAEDLKDLENVISGAIELNYFLPNQGVLFESKIKGYDLNKNLILEKPNNYVQIDRRKCIRLQVNSDEKHIVTFNSFPKYLYSKGFQRTIFDISSGGISILCSKNELKFFDHQNKHKDSKLSILKDEFEIDLKFLYLKELDPATDDSVFYKCFKVSFEFINPNKKLVEYINQYVFNKFSKKENFNY